MYPRVAQYAFDSEQIFSYYVLLYLNILNDGCSVD